MIVDVTWDGVALVKGATAREESNGSWFVELEQPMPVGTRLSLSGELQATVEVARVHEGIGAGVLLREAAARGERAAAHEVDAPTDDKPAAKAEAKPEAKSEAEADGDKDGNGGGKKDRRKKARKTIIGH